MIHTFFFPEIPDPKGGSHHHTHSTKYNSNANDVYKPHKHRPKETYQSISDDDDTSFGSAEDDDDGYTPNIYAKPTRTSLDGHHHHNNNNNNHNNNNNNARYNNIPLFGNGAGSINGNAVGSSNNAIVTRSEVHRGTDNNEVSTATATANIVAAFYHHHHHHHTNYGEESNFKYFYYYYYKMFTMNLLIAVFIRLLS